MAGQFYSRVIRVGRAMYINLPAALAAHMGWKKGDRIAIRPIDRRAVMERVPWEELANMSARAGPRNGGGDE